jgi:hypothetical protein
MLSFDLARISGQNVQKLTRVEMRLVHQDDGRNTMATGVIDDVTRRVGFDSEVPEGANFLPNSSKYIIFAICRHISAPGGELGDEMPGSWRGDHARRHSCQLLPSLTMTAIS